MATSLIKYMAKRPQTIALIVIVLIAVIMVFSTSGATAKFYAAKDVKYTMGVKAVHQTPQYKVASSPGRAGCSDTDGGRVYSAKGTVVDKDGNTYTDHCNNYVSGKAYARNDTLTEYWCMADGSARVEDVSCYKTTGKFCDGGWNEGGAGDNDGVDDGECTK